MAINSISSLFPVVEPAKPAVSQPARIARNSETSDVAAASAGAELAVTSTTQSQMLPNRQQIDQAMEQMREALPPVARNLQFSVDDETGRSIVKVVDATTNEVIRQMPSEELLAIAKALDKFTGLLLKQKA